MSWNAPNLPADKHRFFDRHGGVSNGRYESLNVNRKVPTPRKTSDKISTLSPALSGWRQLPPLFPVRA